MLLSARLNIQYFGPACPSRTLGSLRPLGAARRRESDVAWHPLAGHATHLRREGNRPGCRRQWRPGGVATRWSARLLASPSTSMRRNADTTRLRPRPGRSRSSSSVPVGRRAPPLHLSVRPPPLDSQPKVAPEATRGRRWTWPPARSSGATSACRARRRSACPPARSTPRPTTSPRARRCGGRSV